MSKDNSKSSGDQYPKGNIWKKAVVEKNWGVFALIDQGGPKPLKRPIEAHSPMWPASVYEAFTLPLKDVMAALQNLNNPEKLKKINDIRKERYGSKYDGDMTGALLGYHAKPGSALITIDLDDCVGEDAPNRERIEELTCMFTGYMETSISGTGYRILMPRQDGDEELAITNAEIGGIGVFTKGGKGVALTFDMLEGQETIERDDALLQDLIDERDKLLKEKRKAGHAETSTAEDEIVMYGATDPDLFCAMVEAIPNTEDIDFGRWYGLILAAREHFELVCQDDDEAFDNVRSALADWSENWEGETDGGSKFDELWDEREIKRDANSRTTLGSWFKMAEEACFGFKEGEEREPKDLTKEAAETGFPQTLERFSDLPRRFCLINGDTYDMRDKRFITDRQLLNMAATISMKRVDDKGKAKKLVTRADRYTYIIEHLQDLDELVFAPSRPVIVEDEALIEGRWTPRQGWRCFNAYEPPVIPPEGDERPFVEHVRRLYPEEAEMIFDFLAWQIQYPGIKLNWALVLHGPQGCGKDLMLAAVSRALGKAARVDLPFRFLASEFNDWPVEKTFVAFGEAAKIRMSDQKEINERLKMVIAAPPDTMHVNPKRVAPYSIPNIINVAITTNHMDGVFIDGGDRRYTVASTSEKPDGVGYFERLDKSLPAAAHWLSKRTIRRIEIGHAPQTEGLERMKRASLPDLFDTLLPQMEGKEWFAVEALDIDWELAQKRGARGVGKDIEDVARYLGFKELKGPRADGRFASKNRGATRVFGRGKVPSAQEVIDSVQNASDASKNEQ